MNERMRAAVVDRRIRERVEEASGARLARVAARPAAPAGGLMWAVVAGLKWFRQLWRSGRRPSAAGRRIASEPAQLVAARRS
jgi:hypothetical protein